MYLLCIVICTVHMYVCLYLQYVCLFGHMYSMIYLCMYVSCMYESLYNCDYVPVCFCLKCTKFTESHIECIMEFTCVCVCLLSVSVTSVPRHFTFQSSSLLQVMIVLELLPKGDLKRYLVELKNT